MIEKILSWLIDRQKVRAEDALSEIVWYEHHGKTVAVREVVKGDHRGFCLCWYPCARFHPGDPANQCPRAQELYKFCVANDMVTPVWECPDFVMSGD